MHLEQLDCCVEIFLSILVTIKVPALEMLRNFNLPPNTQSMPSKEYAVKRMTLAAPLLLPDILFGRSFGSVPRGWHIAGLRFGRVY
jgi:hypothetical protein